VKFTSAGEVALSVELASQDERAATLHFAIADTGIGVRPDNTRPFSAVCPGGRVHTREYGGTGLGLSISKQLVGLLGGRSAWKASPGKAPRSGSPRSSRSSAGQARRPPLPWTGPAGEVLVADVTQAPGGGQRAPRGLRCVPVEASDLPSALILLEAPLRAAIHSGLPCWTRSFPAGGQPLEGGSPRTPGGARPRSCG